MITCEECKCRNKAHGGCDYACDHIHTWYFCDCECCDHENEE